MCFSQWPQLVGPSPGLAEAHDCSTRCSCRDKATLLPPGPASQRPVCERGKSVEIKPRSVNTWKVSDDVRVQGQPAPRSCGPLAAPDSLQRFIFCRPWSQYKHIRTLLSYSRFGFLSCLELMSFSNVTCREYKNRLLTNEYKIVSYFKARGYLTGSFLQSFLFCFSFFFLSCNLCQDSLTSFVFYFVWLQQSVCSHLQWIDIICPWPSVGPHSSAKHHVLLCSFLIFFFFNSECVFFSFLQTSVFLRRRLFDSAPDKHGPLKLNPFPLISLAPFVRINTRFLRYGFVRILISNAIWTDPNQEEKRQFSVHFPHFSSIRTPSNWYCFVMINEVSWSIFF